MAEPWEVVARLRPKFAERAAQTDRTGSFPVADFADLRAAGLFGLFTPHRLGGLERDYADYAKVAYELARGNGATALVFNMHASVTGALAGIPDELVRSLGVPEEFFASGPDPGRRGRGRVLRRGHERTGCRFAAIAVDHPVRSHR